MRAHAKRTPGSRCWRSTRTRDLRDEYLDSRYNHACTLRRALDVAPVTQVGLRSASVEDAAFIREQGLAFYSPREYREAGAAAVVAQLSDDVYITIDLDNFDPSEMSAVGTPEPGGLHWDEVSDLLIAVAKAKRDRRVRRDGAVAVAGAAIVRAARGEADVPADRAGARARRSSDAEQRGARASATASESSGGRGVQAQSRRRTSKRRRGGAAAHNTASNDATASAFARDARVRSDAGVRDGDHRGVAGL